MSAIKKYRIASELTQKELALKMGVKQGCISMWERKERNPDIVSLKKLAFILGCTADQLIEDIDITKV